MRADDVQRERDRRDLSRFGYAQQLFREMGGFSNFAISFTCISVLTGAGQFGYGLAMGGPLEMSLGWPLVTVFSLAVAAAMGELCSAFPTSGAMYHWSAALGGPSWGWITASLNIVGLTASMAGIDYLCAEFLTPMLHLPSTTRNLLAVYALILVSHALINQYGIRLVAWLNSLSAVTHIAGVLLFTGALLLLAHLQPPSFLTHLATPDPASPGEPPKLLWWGFVLGLLQAQWTYTGHDASAHVAEETVDPRRRAPWGLVMSVAISGIVGYVLLIALTLAITDTHAVLHATDAQGNAVPAVLAITQRALGAAWASPLMWLTTLAMWFCGVATLTSVSRTVFSLARDKGTPFNEWLKWVSPRHGTPGPAIWTCALAAFVLLVWAGALSVVTSISTIALYAAYVLPVALARPQRAWRSHAVWNLGRWSKPVSAAAIAWTVFICVVFVLPPNQLAGETFAAVLVTLLILYLLRTRHKYTGPAWASALPEAAHESGLTHRVNI